MSSIVSIDARNYDISMGRGFVTFAQGGGMKGNVYLNGNVGIGITTPTVPLDVSGGIRTTGGLEIAKSPAFPNTYIEVASRFFDFHTGATLIDYDSRIIASGGTGVTGKGNIDIAASNIGLLGAVGIGTTNPTSALDVSGVMKTNLIDTQNYDVSMGTGFVRFVPGGGIAGNVFLNGNIGIGTSSPNSRLDVNGAISTSGSITASGSIATNGLISSDGVISSKSSLIAESSTANTGHVRVYAQASANYIQSGLTATSGSAAPLYFTDIFAANRWMTIAANGNVGIGTTTPAYTLDVSGGFRTTGALELAKSPAFPNTYIEVASRFFDFHTGATLIDYDSRIIASGGTGVTGKGNIDIAASNIGLLGAVGIGTTTPTAPLHVVTTSTSNNADTNGIYLNNTTNSAGRNAIIGARVAGTSAGNVWLSMDVLGHTGWSIGIDNRDNQKLKIQNSWDFLTSPEMTIDTNGNVGIGTTNPTAALDVTGAFSITQTGTNSFAQAISNLSGQTAGWNSRLSFIPYLGAAGYNNLSSIGDVGIIWGANTGTNGNLVIGAHRSTAGGIKIMADGRVGIGTSTPTASTYLDINYFKFYTTGYVSFYRQSSTATDGAFDINSNWGATNRFVFSVRSDGNVINWNGSYGAISDVRFKENIIDTPPKLEDLKKVRIVNYNIIGDTDKSIGVIAQELENIFPRLVEEYVDKITNTPYKTVKYSIFIPILIKAFQEQQAQIEQLQIQNQTQQTLLEQLQQRIQALENK